MKNSTPSCRENLLGNVLFWARRFLKHYLFWILHSWRAYQVTMNIEPSGFQEHL
jgi:hypothetical protein